MGFLSSRQRMGMAALILAASAFLSRLMGLVRDKIISWQFGASGEADMYFAAFVVPDIINYLLAGGFMSITIIPLLARGFQQNTDEAWRFFSCICLWMFIASTLFTAIGEIFAFHLAGIVAPGFDEAQRARLAFFMRIILPAQIFFLSGSTYTALLLLRRQFAVPALTPLIYNGLIIICGLCLPLLWGEAGAEFGMTGYCIGVTVGALCGAFLLPMLVAARGGLMLQPVWKHPWLGKFLLIALPLMLGQTVIMLDEQFLRVFGSMLGEGSVSLLNYGRRIAQVPVALMGQAMAMASYPFLVKLLADNDICAFNGTLKKAMAAGCMLIIPCSLLMTASAGPILAIIFQGGRFGPEETLACIPLTQLMLLPAPFWIIYMVLVRGYYALEDTLTPAITGTIATIICIPAYYLIAVPTGAWAVAAISGASISLYVIWLMLIWLRRQGGAAFKGLGLVCIKSLACSLPAAAMSWLTDNALAHAYATMPPFVSACINLVACGVVFGICFLLLAAIIAPDYITLCSRAAKRIFTRKAN